MACAIGTVMKDLADEYVLPDMREDKLRGKRTDLQHSRFLPRTLKTVFAKDYNVTTNPKIFTSTAGSHQQKGETVLNLVQCVVNIFKPFIINVAMIILQH